MSDIYNPQSHRFQGRLDRWCEVCNLPDRDSIHFPPPLSGDEIDQVVAGLGDNIYIPGVGAIECIVGTVSDGYHTFNELYEHRSLLFCALSQVNSEWCWKSKNHWIDGEVKPCHDGWFVACIHLDAGQVSYHMQMEYWSSFRGVDLDRPPAHDGHTSSDVILRLKDFCSPKA